MSDGLEALPDDIEALRVALVAARAEVAAVRAQHSDDQALIAHLPTRLKFKELPQDILRKRDAGGTARMDPGRRVNEDFIVSVLERWRGATMSHNLKFDESGPDLDVPVRDEVAPLQPAPPGLDPNRFKILKRPTEGRADVFSTPRDASKPPLRSPPR